MPPKRQRPSKTLSYTDPTSQSPVIASSAAEEGYTSPESAPQSRTVSPCNRDTIRTAQRARASSFRSSSSTSSKRSSIRASSRRSHRSPSSQARSSAVLDVLTLRKEVLGLFLWISEQETSPLRTYKASAVELESKSQRPLDKGRPQNALEEWKSRLRRVSGKTFTPSGFDLLEWNQQRRLLEREFRRLLTWDSEFSWDSLEEDGFESEALDSVVTYLSDVGKTLAQLLRDEYKSRHSTQAQTLPKRRDSSTLASDEVLSSGIGDSAFRVLQTTIDSLFSLPKHSNWRTNDPQPPSTQDAVRDAEHHRPFSPDGPARSKRRVQAPTGTSIEGEFGSKANESSKKEDSKQQDHPLSGSRPESSDGSSAAIKGSIVLKIFNDLGLSQIETDLGSDSTTAPTSPQAKSHMQSGDKTKNQNRPKLDPKEVPLLRRNFEKLTLTEQFSSAEIADRLLALAKTKLPSLEEVKDGETVAMVPDMNLPASLLRLNSILALVSSLPHWKVYTKAEQKSSARSAVLMIYFSLVEEAMDCALNFTDVCFMKYHKERNIVKVLIEVMLFMYCLRRLSELDLALVTRFYTIRDQLKKTVAEYDKILDSIKEDTPKGYEINIDDKASSPTARLQLRAPQSDEQARLFKGTVKFLFHAYHPLSLVCYLVPSEDDTSLAPNDIAKAKLPSDLEMTTAREVFGRWNPFGPMGGGNQTESPTK